jgi:hypothetical protein
LAGKSKGKRPLGRKRHRQEDLGQEGVEWIKMIENRDKWRVIIRAVKKL